MPDSNPPLASASTGLDRDVIALPARRPASSRAAKAAVGVGYALIAASFAAVVAMLAAELLPDVRGWMRIGVFAGCLAFAVGLGLHLQRAFVRQAARRLDRPMRPWDSRWMALMAIGAGVVLFAGWMPQQRINALAAQPRTWPEKTDRYAMFGMTSRWVGDSVRVELTVRCPRGEDCLHDYGGVNMSFHAADFAWGHIYPYEFTRTGPGIYRAEFGMPFGSRTYRGEYLAATGWGASFLPLPRNLEDYPSAIADSLAALAP